MNEAFILNASPLIVLGKADLLRTLSPLATEWIIPETVVQEVEAKRAIDSYLADLASRSQVMRQEVPIIEPSIASWDLGKGESEVLTIALNTPKAKVVLDDLQARKCATLFQIPLIGSLGLLLLAKKHGIIPLAKPSIERLLAAGLYVNPAIITLILKAVGE